MATRPFTQSQGEAPPGNHRGRRADAGTGGKRRPHEGVFGREPRHRPREECLHGGLEGVDLVVSRGVAFGFRFAPPGAGLFRASR